MKDQDVRSALHSWLRFRHSVNLPSALVVDELGLCGEVRVDVAVVNGALSGFEIKSAADTLARLPKQVEVYSRVLDYATLVVAENHLEESLAMIPHWWGCVVVSWDGTCAHLDQYRPAIFNPGIDPYSLAQLLWKDEALRALEALGADRGVRSKPRQMIWQRLAATAPLETLRRTVRDQLKNRKNWRQARAVAEAVQVLAVDDAMCR